MVGIFVILRIDEEVYLVVWLEVILKGGAKVVGC